MLKRLFSSYSRGLHETASSPAIVHEHEEEGASMRRAESQRLAGEQRFLGHCPSESQLPSKSASRSFSLRRIRSKHSFTAPPPSTPPPASPYSPSSQGVPASKPSALRQTILKLKKPLVIKKANKTSSSAATEIVEVVPGKLYLSGWRGAKDREALKSRGVVAVINCTRSVPNYYKKDFAYYSLHLKDTKEENLEAWFHSVAKFIDSTYVDRQGAVLVHCREGVSRSPAFAMAYLLISTHARTLREAYGALKAVRPQIAPQPAFVEQLARLEVALNPHLTEPTMTAEDYFHRYLEEELGKVGMTVKPEEMEHAVMDAGWDMDKAFSTLLEIAHKKH